jgi:RNA polymerase sigma factor (sigma-70 family)
MTAGVDKETGDGPVVELVTRARNGDQDAWDALVDRYASLVWSICRRYRLNGTDAGDVGQNVWLQLLNQLDRIRDPAALPGWLATTTRRECGRVARAAHGPHAAGGLSAAGDIPDPGPGPEQELVAAERRAVVLEAFSHLPARDQLLLTLLTQDPPVPYAEISSRMDIPIGSIGPLRRRGLERLRRHPALAALIGSGSGR